MRNPWPSKSQCHEAVEQSRAAGKQRQHIQAISPVIEATTIFEHHALVEVETGVHCFVNHETALSRIDQHDRPNSFTQPRELNIC